MNMINEVTLLSPPANFAVVQLLGRKFRGVVVQGDTLHCFVSALDDMERMLHAGDYEDLLGEINSVKEQLSEALAHYEEVCRKRKITLPYPTR
jgi:hypothetical protein